MVVLVTQCSWTIRILQLISGIVKKQNCHSVLVSRYCWTEALQLPTMFLLMFVKVKRVILFLNLDLNLNHNLERTSQHLFQETSTGTGLKGMQDWLQLAWQKM